MKLNFVIGFEKMQCYSLKYTFCQTLNFWLYFYWILISFGGLKCFQWICRFLQFMGRIPPCISSCLAENISFQTSQQTTDSALSLSSEEVFPNIFSHSGDLEFGFRILIMPCFFTNSVNFLSINGLSGKNIK